MTAGLQIASAANEQRRIVWQGAKDLTLTRKLSQPTIDVAFSKRKATFFMNVFGKNWG